MNTQAWTDETLVGAGTAKVRDGVFAGRTGTIEAYAYGTVMLSGVAREPMPFGLGEIETISESKSDGAALDASKRMPRFLKFIAEWAEANATAGRRIVPDVQPGPGTMTWRAE